MRSSVPAGSLHHEAAGDPHTLKSVSQELQPGKQKKSSVLSMVFLWNLITKIQITMENVCQEWDCVHPFLTMLFRLSKCFERRIERFRGASLGEGGT